MKSAAFAGLAFHTNMPPHERDQPAADGQPQSRAAKATCRRAVGLGERLEDLSLMLWRYTDAGVADGKVNSHASVVGRFGFGTDNDLAFLRELDGIADQVHEHLPQAQWITDKFARRVARNVIGQL